MPDRHPRSRLPSIFAAAVLVLLIVAAGGYLLGRTGNPTPSATSPAAASSPPAVALPSTTTSSGDTGDGSDAAAPSGCLGGQGRTVSTVLTAQQQAGHTAFGAADLLATYFRWGFRYPYPTSSDVKALTPMYTPRSAATLKRSAAQAYEGPYRAPAGGGVKADTPYYLSMASGLWTIAEGGTSDRVTVSVQGNYVIDDVFSPTKQAGITATFVWTNGAWHVDSFAQPDLARVTAGGTAFTSGC